MGGRTRARILVIALAAAWAFVPALAGAGMKTPIVGWNDEEFSLWPIVYVGHGGFSIPGLRITDDSWSIPFFHHHDKPAERYDATPLYHHEEGVGGFALGPRRETVNDGIQGFANTVFDFVTVVTNTRQLVSDSNEEYETYREYGDPKQPIPGQEKGPVATLPAPEPAPAQEPVAPARP